MSETKKRWKVKKKKDGTEILIRGVFHLPTVTLMAECLNAHADQLDQCGKTLSMTADALEYWDGNPMMIRDLIASAVFTLRNRESALKKARGE